MERPKIKFPEHPTKELNPLPRKRSVMPNMARVQMMKADDSKPPVEKINEPDKQTVQILPLRKKKRFEDSYSRFTTYLENSLHIYVLELRQQGQIESATALVNDALLEYIKRHFGRSFEK